MNKIKSFFQKVLIGIVIGGVICLFLYGVLLDKKERDLEREKQVLMRVQVEAVKHGAGEWVGDTNGEPVFRWKTHKEVTHEQDH